MYVRNSHLKKFCVMLLTNI